MHEDISASELDNSALADGLAAIDMPAIIRRANPDVAPIDYLLQLSAKVHKLAPILPSQDVVKISWSGIGFAILGRRLVAPLNEVIEMLPVPPVTRLPGVQPWVLGIANVRGRLLPLFDMETYFTGIPAPTRIKQRVLVLEMGELYAGLVVNEVYGKQHFPEDVPLTELPAALQHLSAYSKGAYYHDNITWLTFSPFNLIRDPRFFSAASTA